MCCLVNNYIKGLSFGMEIFVLGDLNCDLLKSCHTLNRTQLVTSPTRVTPQSSS